MITRINEKKLKYRTKIRTKVFLKKSKKGNLKAHKTRRVKSSEN